MAEPPVAPENPPEGGGGENLPERYQAPHFLDRFFEWQEGEQNTRRAEVDSSKEVALAQIQAVKEDRAGERATASRNRDHTLVFIGFLVVFCIISVGFAVAYNKTELALEIIKTAALLFGGGGIGWGLGRRGYHRNTDA